MTEDGAARRLIEWTGERCVPWTDDTQVIYEHYHRYALATRYAAGKRVLDLACGEGYGAAMLAGVAAEVVGVDIDRTTVEHARAAYRAVTNFRADVGSITDENTLADAGKFDVITCFEALEHVLEQDALLRLVRARLVPGGLFLVSTPDVTVYTHEHGNQNEFHVRELTEEAFRALLGGAFANVALLRQNVATGSLVVAEHPRRTGAQAHSLRRDGADNWSVAEGVPHTYLLIIASDGPLPDIPGVDVLVDPELTLVRQAQQRAAAGAERGAAAEISRLRDLCGQAEAGLAEAEARRVEAEAARVLAEAAAEQAGARAEALAAEAIERDIALTGLRDEQERQADALTTARRSAELTATRLEWTTENLERLVPEIGRLAHENAQLRTAQSATAQRIVNRYRSAVERLAPRGTLRRDVYEKAWGRPAGVLPGAGGDLGPVGVTTSDKPVVSVIVPVHGHWAHTRKCLVSIESSRPTVPFEVIVVDDASPDDSADKLAACPGIRLVRAPRNLGFIGACNLGAKHARSDLLMFLNNDTEVRPRWLDELVGTVTEDDRIGLVGSKLLYPDGRLQECGGIIWADGTGWNYGRGDNPDDPRYAAVRNVDYCSGAALLVRRELFEEFGGFDRRYAPAYYEDTDLAFAVRAAGYRTVVQPRSVVVHHEGVSNGTDLGRGIKRYQELNRHTFAEKWAEALADHLPEPKPDRLWVARQRTASGHRGGLVLVIDHQVPTPDRDSGSVRMRRILEELVKLGHRVVFIPANGAPLQPFTGQLEQLGITVITSVHGREEFFREAGPQLDLAILSRPNVAWLVLEQLRDWAPDCLIAYDTVDLHFVRLSRQADMLDSLGESRRAAVLRRRADASRELELALVRGCDLTLTVSETERELLRELVPQALVEVMSNVHEAGGRVAALAARTRVLFVGSFDHHPNRDAATWLAEEIWPLVRAKCPDAVLDIVGSNPPAEIFQLAGDGVDVRGWVADLEPIYRTTRVALAPLRFGAGVKGKVGESLSAGVPVVGTSLAFEGMHLRDGAEVLVGADPQELASHIVELLTDDVLWHRLSEAGRAAIVAQFGPQVARGTLRKVLAHAAAQRGSGEDARA